MKEGRKEGEGRKGPDGMAIEGRKEGGEKKDGR